MAELPEIETLRHDLEREVAGKRIKSVEFTGMKSLARYQNRKQVAARLEGVKVTAVKRRGLLLLFKLDSNEYLIVDAGEAGHLVRTAAKDPVTPHTQAIITFTQGGQLRVVDPTDGGLQMAIVDIAELGEEFPELADYGPDPVDDPMSWLAFADILRRHQLKLKNFLTDPTVLLGIGPIYSDEILWDAGLRADRVSNALSSQEIRRLYRSVVETMHDAIKHRGTSIGDDPWVDLAGRPGGFQELLNAYGRDGQACKRCRGTITKKKFGGKVTFSCEDCQV
jgi:formamidopyrimidine-DNA glycosylase